MNPIQVIGLGLTPDDLAPRLLGLIRDADVLAGGKRHLGYFPDFKKQTIALAANLSEAIEEIAGAQEQGMSVVVLASGDPGFYGIADRLVRRLGPENVVVHPNITAFQAAFARLRIPWQKAALVSVHGRDKDGFWSALAQNDLVSIYTEPRFGPAEMAVAMISRNQAGWRMHVLEDLGADNERIGTYTLADASTMTFSGLNVVVLERTEPVEPLSPGGAEDRYEHEAGLITKSEIRSVALGKLDLRPNQTFWDLGAGSGSVGIEASRLIPGGRIMAVEKNPARVEFIKANQKKFGVAQLEVVQAQLPEGLADLPAPDRVFIGGGGEALGDVIDHAAARLSPGGVLVAAVVQLDSLTTARTRAESAGLTVEIVQVQVSRAAPLGRDVYFKALNPVWLVTGRKDFSDE